MSRATPPIYRATLDHHRACFDGLAASNSNESQWISELRANAMAGFEELGFPHPKLEEWRYTNVGPIAKVEFEPVASTPELPETLAAGVAVTSLAALRLSAPDRLRTLLEQTPPPKDRAFALLNAAFLDDGALVEIGPDATANEPIHVRFPAPSPTAGRTAPSARHPRVVVTAKPGSKAVVIVSFEALASEPGALTNSVVDVHVAANASLDVVLVQRERKGTFHVSNTSARVDRDARLGMHTVSLGGEIVRNDLEVALADVGAECDLRGLFLGQGNGIVDNHTSVDHAMPHGTSRELYKGILADASRGVFRGKVTVRPDAQKTDATQSNPNLLLGPGAEIDTKPQLEIYADDVKCAHGATVGQLDPEALFYLQSRGIGKEAGRALLTRAFANEITDALPDEDLRLTLGREIDDALGTPAAVEDAQ